MSKSYLKLSSKAALHPILFTAFRIKSPRYKRDGILPRENGTNASKRQSACDTIRVTTTTPEQDDRASLTAQGRDGRPHLQVLEMYACEAVS